MLLARATLSRQRHFRAPGPRFASPIALDFSPPDTTLMISLTNFQSFAPFAEQRLRGEGAAVDRRVVPAASARARQTRLQYQQLRTTLNNLTPDTTDDYRFWEKVRRAIWFCQSNLLAPLMVDPDWEILLQKTQETGRARLDCLPVFMAAPGRRESMVPTSICIPPQAGGPVNILLSRKWFNGV